MAHCDKRGVGCTKLLETCVCPCAACTVQTRVDLVRTLASQAAAVSQVTQKAAELEGRISNLGGRVNKLEKAVKALEDGADTEAAP